MEENATRSVIFLDSDEESCKGQVFSIFEDIDPQYLDELAEEHDFEPDAVIATILDKQEKGQPYPKRTNRLKRKRDDDDRSEETEVEGSNSNINAKINDPAYLDQMRSAEYKDMAALLISQDFPLVPKTTIRSKLLFGNGCSVFRTYIAMDTATRNWDPIQPSWLEKKHPTKLLPQYSMEKIQNLNRNELSEDKCAALDEFLAARQVKAERDAEKAAESAERRNLEQARKNGEMGECGCCCDEYPINRMVHCEGTTVHLFCRPCMRQQAETTIGYSKYEISCLSMDGCTAGFSVAQKDTFLDKKLWIALDRIEALAVLEAAGFENLETCPFCPMAMEYPPVEENKEFRCANHSCGIVSCRLCRKITHIPKTCAEAAAEEVQSARHVVEEAMSMALIRKCNRCSQSYVKEDGCNKITCTKCGALQCYVCRQTVKDYTHFNDKARGGKQGQCPLFEQSTEERHQNEVRQAEEASRLQVVKDHPEMNAEVLKLRLSERVMEDEKNRVGRRASHIHIVRPPVPRAAVEGIGVPRRVRFQGELHEPQHQHALMNFALQQTLLRHQHDRVMQQELHRQQEQQQRLINSRQGLDLTADYNDFEAAAQVHRDASQRIHYGLQRLQPVQSPFLDPEPNVPARPQPRLAYEQRPPPFQQPCQIPNVGQDAANPIVLRDSPVRLAPELRENMHNEDIFLPVLLIDDHNELHQVGNHELSQLSPSDGWVQDRRSFKTI